MYGRLKPVKKRPPSRGLAPLELVLALPILLFVTALMVNFGTVASSRVDGLVAARHEGWASRSGRSWQVSPPATGAVAGSPSADLQPEVALVREQHPVIHGPMPMGTLVNPDLLDPTRGMRQGSRQSAGQFPILQSLGPYRIDSRANLLDDKWQHGEMGISNNSWRIPLLYALATDVPAAYPFAYLRAAIAILNPALQRALRPLEHDDEFEAYRLRFGWAESMPASYPAFPQELCSLDHAAVKTRVDQLVDEIVGKRGAHDHGVPEHVTRWFLWFYNRAIQDLQGLLQATPPPSPGEIGAIQAEIAQLQKKIDTLQTFLQTLP